MSKATEKASEAIFDAVRFLAPDEAHRLLAEAAERMKVLADKYDALLQDALCD